MTDGVSASADLRDIAQPDGPAARAVDQQVLDVLETAAGRRHALHDHVEDLLVLEQAADLDALDQRGLGPAYVPGRHADGLRLLQVDLDLDRGLHGRLDQLGTLHTVDTRDGIANPAGGLLEDDRVLAVHAHGQWCVDPGEQAEAGGRRVAALDDRSDFVHPLGGVGHDVGGHAGQVAYGLLQQADRLVVVGIGIDAHPDIGGVHVDDPVATDRPAQVRGRGGDPGHVLHGAAELGRLGRHPLPRRPGRSLELKRDVAITEARDQRWTEERNGDGSDDGAGRRRENDRPDAPTEPGQGRLVAPADPLERVAVAETAGLRRAQQQHGQCRGDDDRDQEGRSNGHRVRRDQRGEERTGPAVDHRRGHDGQPDDHGGIDQGSPGRDPALPDRLRDRLGLRLEPLLAQPPERVVRRRDCFIDHDGQGGRQPGEHERIHFLAQRAENQRGGDDRQRHRDDGDHDCSPLQPQREQRGEHQDPADQ